jgi:voltage-gated sodium channel
MVSVVPSLRRVISGLLNALPGLGSVGAIMLLIFYVGSVMATKLFGEGFPEWFGTLGESAYSLFQIMTLESWSMGVVRPVMEKFPFAWAFFLPFILIATFTMLNLFIAVIVNAMQAETDKAAMERAERSHDERELMLQEIRDLNHKVDLLLSINKKQ